jgi:hypothetical protein
LKFGNFTYGKPICHALAPNDGGRGDFIRKKEVFDFLLGNGSVLRAFFAVKPICHVHEGWLSLRGQIGDEGAKKKADRSVVRL